MKIRLIRVIRVPLKQESKMKKILLILTIIILLPTLAHAQMRAYRIGNNTYINAQDFAKEFKFNINWDDTQRILSLSAPAMEIKLLNNQNYFLINKDFHGLNSKIISYKGGFFIPAEFMGQVKDKLLTMSNRLIKKPIYKEPYKIKKIVIDPGHGGKDSGACGTRGLQEKAVVLDIAFKLRRLLHAYGYDIIMTRSEDIFIPLWKRADIANKTNADLFISIHANASQDNSASGMEVFYLSDAMDDYSRSIESAENASLSFEDKLHSQYSFNFNHTRAAIWDLTCDAYRRESIILSNIVLKNMTSVTNFKKRGVKCARFYVLKHTLLPSILIETGFVTNSSEESSLSQDKIRLNIANAILKGVLEYSQDFERTQGFTV